MVSFQEIWELVLKHWIEDYSWTFKQKKANSDSMALGEGRPCLVLTTWYEYPQGERDVVDPQPRKEALGIELSEKIQDA